MRTSVASLARSQISWMFLVFAVSLVWLMSGIRVGPGSDAPRFDIDEAGKIAESYYFHLFVATDAWHHPDWHTDFYARTNTPVGKYVFGAALAATGQPITGREGMDDFDRLWRNPVALRRSIPDRVLRVTRTVSAIYGALVCALLAGVARRAAGGLAGVAVGALLLSNSYFVDNARRGLTDTILLFHLSLILPVTMLAARTLRTRAGVRASLLRTVLAPAVVIALAAGSKLNGALAGPIYAAGLLLAATVAPGDAGRARAWRRALLASGLTAILAFALLVLLNPTFQDAPIVRLYEAFEIFGDWMVKQQIDPGPALLDLRGRAAFVAFGVLRGPAAGLSQVLGGAGSALQIAGLVVGLLVLFARLPATGSAQHGDPTGRASESAVILCWVLAVLVVTTVWMPVARDRYLLPAILAACLAMGIGMGSLPEAMRLFARLARWNGGARGRWRALAAASTLPALALGVLWLADPTHVAPTAGPDFRRPEVQRAYLEAARANPQSMEMQRSAGLIALISGRPGEAIERYDAALALLSEEEEDGAGAASSVRRSTLLFDLARARAAAGDGAGASRALREDSRTLAELRAGLRSGDPFVIRAFDELIREREELAAGFETGGGAP